LNRPGRLEHYVMLVVREVRRFMGLFTRDAGSLDLESMRIPFERRGPAAGKSDAAAKVARSKSAWGAALGLPVGGE
jgi:hypothetical protein